MPGPGEQHKAGTTSVNPFEETKPHINQYTAQDIATLSSRLEKQLGPEYISSRPGPGGAKVHYLAADKCIALANEVFGFNGWSSGIQNIQVDFVDENQHTGAVTLGLSVIVRVTLRDGTYHEDIGYGQIKNCKGKAEAFEKAKKEGTTDGLKRALRNFGNLLGNCIYDKDYVSKVTKLKVMPARWDADNLHRHPDFAPIRKDPEPREDIRPKREIPAETDTSLTVHGDAEDEFGCDEFDEVDLAVAGDGPPDGVTLDPGVPSNHFRSKVGLPPRRDIQSLPQTHSRTHPTPPRQPAGPQTPSAAPASGPGQPFKAEISSALPPIQRAPYLPTPAASNQQSGAQALNLGGFNQKPAEVVPAPRPVQTLAPTVPSNTPPLDSSNTTEHNPPVSFFTARAAESIQKGAALPSNVPTFNPHLESPSIRKTAGVDHTKSKPVRTETIGASPAAAPLPPRNFVEPQADKTRKLGMPQNGAGSPLQNRHSYKPLSVKRPVGGNAMPNNRPALNDVTSASINMPNDAGGDVKRQRTAESGQGVGIS